MHDASSSLALCDMKVLYLRNVPDEVGEGLEQLASREGMSVSAFAVRELAVIARRAANPRLLGELPDLSIEASPIVADLERERERR